MIPKLTHTEACELVESALERVGKTLAYIRLKLDKRPIDKPVQLDLFAQDALEEANLLCNINWYGAYLHGAITMLRKLRDNQLLEEPHKEKVTAEDKLYKKAELDMLISDKCNIERFLNEDYDEIRFTDHERNKKGKLTKCRAYFAKRVTTSVEIKD